MENNKSCAIIFDKIFQNHMAPEYHPERSERLEAIGNILQENGMFEKLVNIPVRRATKQELELVHDSSYVEDTGVILGKGISGYLDMGDTYYSPGTDAAAFNAVGSGIDLALGVFNGKYSGGISLVRPPGHHAEKKVAMGFCVFNNIAVAAAALLENGAKRVAIMDFDVHHGNGTQHLFENDPRVLYSSIHQSPLFPGTGNYDEVGKGEGFGYTINAPLAPYCEDSDWFYAMNNLIIPSIREFEPDIILVSAGFDAHTSDEISNHLVTSGGFYKIEAALTALADEICHGKIAVFLEGGYNLKANSRGVLNFFEILLSRPGGVEIENKKCTQSTITTIEKVRNLLSPKWKSLDSKISI
jgi:acetoin utilization deacetylase AcuC-like enzyme